MRSRLGDYLRVCLIVLFFPPTVATAQTSIISGELVETRYDELSTFLNDYSLYRIDMEGLVELVRSDEANINISFDLPGEGHFDVSIYPHEIRSQNYRLVVKNENGTQVVPHDPAIKTFRGYTPSGGVVRFTIDADFLYGTLTVKGEKLVMQSASFDVPGLDASHIVVYREGDALEIEGFDCEPLPIPGRAEASDSHDGGGFRSMMECREVEIAFANDWLMNQDHGGVTGVENHNLAVINDVQGNYDDEFADEFEFNVVQIFVSDCSTCDPWTSSTSSSALLNDFSTWAGPNLVSHDVATLWSDRDFNGTTIGLAWLDAVCQSGFKYNVCEDFSNNANFLRVLLAHELGHNFGSGHDPSGSNTIMAPSVTNTATWSASSVSQINNYTNSIGCLSTCATSEPPVASFSSDITEVCPGEQVQFVDESTGATSWNWLFPGGTPSESAEQDPTVVYNTPGVYDVVLEVSNQAGQDVATQTDLIMVRDLVTASFDYSTDGLTVFFVNFSDGDGTETYDWNFGDGMSSNDFNPVHEYFIDGVYTVVLTVEGVCNIDVFEIEVEVISLPVADFSYSSNEGCAPFEVNFENQSSNNVDEYLWEFEGGIPAFSQEFNPTVVYPDPGLFGVTLTVINSSGQHVLIVDDLVSVNSIPEAAFELFVNGVDLQIDNQSVNGSTYFWDFGDGTTSTEFAPNHTYAAGGVYDVMLVVENECGADTTFGIAVIESAPFAAMSISQSEGCIPLTVQYSYSGGGDVDSYAWTFQGGSPSSSSEQNPVIIYGTAGTYSVELIVTNEFGADTVIEEDVITVFEDVIANFDYGLNGQIASFENLSSGESQITWIINGVEFTEENPVVDFGEDGMFPVMLIAQGQCGTDTSEVVINVATPPTAGIGISSTQGCEPFVVQFEDQSSANTSGWEWTFPGGSPGQSNLPNPIVTYNEPGTYSVSLVVTNNVGSDEVFLDEAIVVDPLPTALFGTDQNGTVITFSNSSIDATSYFWRFGDGSTSTETEPAHDYGAFGMYEVILIATNSCGADTIIQNLTLSGLPIPDFTVSSPDGCAPYEITFEDLSQNGANSWEWTFEGGSPATSSLQNPTVVYNQPGSYDVSLRVSNEAGSQTVFREEYIHVGTIPESSFEFEVEDESVTFINSSVDADQFLWDFGDGETSEEMDPEHVYSSTGTYSVILIAYNNCGADTSTFDVTVQTTSNNTPEWEAEIGIWPNPNDGRFNLSIQDVVGPIEMLLIDASGTILVKRTFVTPTVKSFDFSSQLSKGMYFVRLSSSDGAVLRKIIVQ